MSYEKHAAMLRASIVLVLDCTSPSTRGGGVCGSSEFSPTIKLFSSNLSLPFPACGAVKVPQGRIVGGNETYEGEVNIRTSDI